MKTYVKFFDTRDDAYAHMLEQNQARTGANRQPCEESFVLYCLVDGPEDNFAIVDLETAINLGGPYEWQT